MIGVGDMSGESSAMACCSSRQIEAGRRFRPSAYFIDPNPDAAISWNEREADVRTAALELADYNAGAYFKGGGVFVAHVEGNSALGRR